MRFTIFRRAQRFRGSASSMRKGEFRFRGARGDTEGKKKLLQEEGVVFSNETIDLDEYGLLQSLERE